VSRVGHTVAGLKLLSQFADTRASQLYLGECDDGRCLVKLVRAELCAERDRVERALDAARAVGALDHRGIEFVIEAGWDGDDAYVLGDIVPGTTAARLIERRMLDAESATAIVGLIADALAAAHAIGVVHGAVEPTVVHVGFASDRVVVRDFGLAALAGDIADAPAEDVRALGELASALLAAAIDATPPEIDALVARMRAGDTAARPTAADVRDALAARARGAVDVAAEGTAAIQRRRAPTDPPPGTPARQEPEVDEERPVTPPVVRLARGAAWSCDRCGARNTRARAFCVHCGAPASAPRDVGALMAALVEHASDEVTPPPGPPPEPARRRGD
jgi:serine/threonine protein kinase